MTHGRIAGRVFGLILLLTGGALALGPSVVENALAERADELAALIDISIAPLSLRVDIARVEIRRGPIIGRCQDGTAHLHLQSLLTGKLRLRSLTFAACSIVSVETQGMPAAVGDDEDIRPSSGLEGALDALAELPDIQRIRVDHTEIDAWGLVASAADLEGTLHHGELRFGSELNLEEPVEASIPMRGQVDRESATLSLEGEVQVGDWVARDASIELTRGGGFGWRDLNVRSALGTVTATSFGRSPTGELSVNDARVSLSIPMDPSAARALFGRAGLTRRSAPTREGVGLARQAIDATPIPSALFDRARAMLDEVPLRIEFDGLSVEGVPHCESLRFDELILEAGTVIASGACDDARFSVSSTANATSLNFSGVNLERVIPGTLGTVDAVITPERTVDGVDATLELTFREFGVQHDAVSAEPVVANVTATITASLPADPSAVATTFALSGRIGEVSADATLRIEPSDGGWELLTEGGVSAATLCDTIWEAMPQGLIPSLRSANVTFSGAAAPRLRASYTIGSPDSFDMRQAGFMGDCTIDSIDASFDPRLLLADDYVHTVSEHVSAPVQVGPGTWGYATLDELPSYVPALMHMSEEIGFFDNPGFSMMLMRRAVRMNIRESRYVYGGSTVSQQLVKNLFFTRDKTLARKFEEAIVVWAMEQVVSKERILELYLNCVEFAPDVYGVTAAARHYFDKRPEELTPLEAAFLAALKPAPARGERHRARGHSPDTGWWHERLQVLLQRLVDHGPYIDQAEAEYYAPYIVSFPTIEHADEVEVEARPRPKWANTESFTEARERLETATQ